MLVPDDFPPSRYEKVYQHQDRQHHPERVHFHGEGFVGVLSLILAVASVVRMLGHAGSVDHRPPGVKTIFANAQHLVGEVGAGQ